MKITLSSIYEAHKKHPMIYDARGILNLIDYLHEMNAWEKFDSVEKAYMSYCFKCRTGFWEPKFK